MRAGIVMVLLLLVAAVSVPVVADAGECDAAVVFFSGPKDVLDVVNFTFAAPLGTQISFAFWSNDGTFAGDTLLTVPHRGRARYTAKQIYATANFTPPIEDSWVRIRLSPPNPFAAFITTGDGTREVGCVVTP